MDENLFSTARDVAESCYGRPLPPLTLCDGENRRSGYTSDCGIIILYISMRVRLRRVHCCCIIIYNIIIIYLRVGHERKLERRVRRGNKGKSPEWTQTLSVWT